MHLVKKHKDGLVGGVIASVAERFQADVWVARVAILTGTLICGLFSTTLVFGIVAAYAVGYLAIGD